MRSLRALRTLRRASSSGPSVQTGAHMRIVSINDVYELHALPRLKTLINEQKPQIVTLVRTRARPLSAPRTAHACCYPPCLTGSAATFCRRAFSPAWTKALRWWPRSTGCPSPTAASATTRPICSWKTLRCERRRRHARTKRKTYPIPPPKKSKTLAERFSQNTNL